MTTKTRPSTAAFIRHHARIQRMLADPDCTGDLLLLGIALAQYADFGLTYDDDSRLETFGRLVFGDRTNRARDVIRQDIRRYDGIKDNGGSFRTICGAPMIRRKGPCGNSATIIRTIVDLDTGRSAFMGACSRPEHKAWLESRAASNRDAQQVVHPPDPVANAGGVLARHIPEIAWETLWKHLDPTWTAPPEDSPYRRPTLALHLGDADGGSGRRPRLAVVAGNGEGVNVDGGVPDEVD